MVIRPGFLWASCLAVLAANAVVLATDGPPWVLVPAILLGLSIGVVGVARPDWFFPASMRRELVPDPIVEACSISRESQARIEVLCDRLAAKSFRRIAIDHCRGRHDPLWREDVGHFVCAECAIPLDVKRRSDVGGLAS
jgi:hypothetical protein